MDIKELDRLITERQNRLLEKKENGVIPFSEEFDPNSDPKTIMLRERERLVKEFQQTNITEFDTGLTPQLEYRRKQIQGLVEGLDIKLQALQNESS